MTIEPYGEKWSFIDYKGQKRIAIIHGFENRYEMSQLEFRLGRKYRNNDPDNPKIPSVGDKVRLDTKFSYTNPKHNSAIGKIIKYPENKNSFNDFYTFQDEKTLEEFLIKPSDIQWYYNP